MNSIAFIRSHRVVKFFRLSCYAVSFLGFSFLSFGAHAAPKAKEIPYWRQSNIEDQRTINHAKFQEFIDAYLRFPEDDVARIDYGAISAARHARLKSYIGDLAAFQITSYNKKEQKAYWINLYNALTVDLVLDNYPVDSITDISAGFLSFGPWGKDVVTIEGQSLSLNDIEHGIVRPIFKDPRMHYVLNCASYSCPNIPDKAVTSENLESILNMSAKSYINHLRGVDVSGFRLRISEIYDWYEDDFGSTAPNILRHLKQYADPELKNALERFKKFELLDYNWTLNDSRFVAEGAVR